MHEWERRAEAGAEPVEKCSQPPSRRCPACGRELPASAFYQDRSKRSGLTSRCRECILARERTAAQARTPADRARKQEYRRAYYDTNRDAARDYARHWRAANAGHVRLYRRKWRHANAASRLTSHQLWQKSADVRLNATEARARAAAAVARATDVRKRATLLQARLVELLANVNWHPMLEAGGFGTTQAATATPV